eukprot:COSAG06_NODE_6256_length_3011_cov_4.921360_2_plen_139_part_00
MSAARATGPWAGAPCSMSKRAHARSRKRSSRTPLEVLFGSKMLLFGSKLLLLLLLGPWMWVVVVVGGAIVYIGHVFMEVLSRLVVVLDHILAVDHTIARDVNAIQPCINLAILAVEIIWAVQETGQQYPVAVMAHEHR